jgi:Na+/H+ antiporter NhaC
MTYIFAAVILFILISSFILFKPYSANISKDERGDGGSLNQNKDKRTLKKLFIICLIISAIALIWFIFSGKAHLSAFSLGGFLPFIVKFLRPGLLLSNIPLMARLYRAIKQYRHHKKNNKRDEN